MCSFPFFFPQGYSCVDLQNGGMRHSGVYYLQIRGTTYWFLKVFCEQDIADGGWTVSKMHELCTSETGIRMEERVAVTKPDDAFWL